MRNVTEVFKNYRICLREIWNRCFWADTFFQKSDNSEKIWNAVKHFDRLVPFFFDALVMEKLINNCCVEENLSKGTYDHIFRIVPAGSTTIWPFKKQDRTGESFKNPISGRGSTESGIKIEAKQIDMRFLNFFEWSATDCYDLKYYVVEIRSFPEKPELEGREALVDVEGIEVWVNPEDLKSIADH